MRSLLTILKNIMNKLSSLTSSVNSKMEMELVWRNANPNNAFNTQTINVDLKGYDGVLIIYIGNSWNGSAEVRGTLSTYIKVPENGILHNANMATNNSYYTHSKTRFVTVNEASIVFGTGYVSRVNAAPTHDSFSCLPLEIYGIKLGGVLTNLIRRWQYA